MSLKKVTSNNRNSVRTTPDNAHVAVVGNMYIVLRSV